MTIEEYDNLAEIRKTIDDIDRVLKYLNEHEDSQYSTFKGIGYIDWGCFTGLYGQGINDPVVVERFKQLLIERKKELVEEFSR